uniref:Uncharacterized protein n=1 Tax=Leersia perrieri TaxID=77586 RepID=A0A0D9WI39_9ORYZ
MAALRLAARRIGAAAFQRPPPSPGFFTESLDMIEASFPYRFTRLHAVSYVGAKAFAATGTYLKSKVDGMLEEPKVHHKDEATYS